MMGMNDLLLPMGKVIHRTGDRSVSCILTRPIISIGSIDKAKSIVMKLIKPGTAPTGFMQKLSFNVSPVNDRRMLIDLPQYLIDGGLSVAIKWKKTKENSQPPIGKDQLERELTVRNDKRAPLVSRLQK